MARHGLKLVLELVLVRVLVLARIKDRQDEPVSRRRRPWDAAQRSAAQVRAEQKHSSGQRKR